MNGQDKKEVSNIYVGLKEHFEQLWKERKDNIELQFNGVAKTLKATAKEIAHRLEVLNHAHTQSLEDRTEFVKVTEYNAKAESILSEVKGVVTMVGALEKSFNDKHDAMERNFNDKHNNLSRIVYIGLGIMIALQILWPLFAKSLKVG